MRPGLTSETFRLSALGLFFFNDTATTEIYTLALHDALPIWSFMTVRTGPGQTALTVMPSFATRSEEHTSELQSRGLISYAVFRLKKTESAPDKGSCSQHTSHTLEHAHATWC